MKFYQRAFRVALCMTNRRLRGLRVVALSAQFNDWTQRVVLFGLWSPPADNCANGLVASHNITCRAKDNIQTAAAVKWRHHEGIDKLSRGWRGEFSLFKTTRGSLSRNYYLRWCWNPIWKRPKKLNWLEKELLFRQHKRDEAKGRENAGSFSIMTLLCKD